MIKSFAIAMLQWILGFLGVIGIFDMFMRLSRKSPWMLAHPGIIAIDAIFIIAFVFSLVLPRLFGGGRFKKI